MALGALEVPGLVDAGPVQRVAGLELLVGVEVEPALAALVLRPAVPGDAQRLHPAVGKGDQVLLQRRDAEGVADLEVGELAVRAVGIDQELAVAPEEPRGDVAVGEGGAIEVAEDGLLGGFGHRQVVVRAAPGLGLGLMAAGAGGDADEAGRGCRCRGGVGAALPAGRKHQSRRCRDGAKKSTEGSRHLANAPLAEVIDDIRPTAPRFYGVLAVRTLPNLVELL